MARNKPRDSRAALGNDNQPGIHSWLPVPLRRIGYRCAYLGLRIWWFVRRPNVNGVKCVLTDGDRVLLVRHTYGHRGWDLPGGTVKRGEEPETAATREMHEELGVSVEEWAPIGQLRGRLDHRRDQLDCFQAELREPSIAIDLGELSAAGWFERDRLPSDLGRYVKLILTRAVPSRPARA
jgi:8-oxo-dGTP pyrophosphatase MutT (NUDIX family)